MLGLLDRAAKLTTSPRAKTGLAIEPAIKPLSGLDHDEERPSGLRAIGTTGFTFVGIPA